MVFSLINSEAGTLLLLFLLIAAFVVAFKVMQMVFETILVSVISGGFYLALVYFMSFPFSFERVLLFAFLGATLYMAYSFLASMYSIASSLIGIPYHIVKYIFMIPVTAVKKLYGHMKEKKRLKEIRSESRDYSNDEDSEGVKETVLDKVGKD